MFNIRVINHHHISANICSNHNKTAVNGEQIWCPYHILKISCGNRISQKLINTDNVASGVNVEVGKEQVAVDLNVIVEYQKNVPELYKKIKEVVVSEISKMTDLEVVEVNVDVVDIKTKEQHEADSVSLQDRVTGVVESTSEFTSDKFESAKQGLSDGFSAAKEKVSEGVEAVSEATAKAEPRVH